MCQHPNSLACVASAPAHQQRDREEGPWVNMESCSSIRLIEPMRLIAEQCAVPPQNLVRGQPRCALRLARDSLDGPGAEQFCTKWLCAVHAVGQSVTFKQS